MSEESVQRYDEYFLPVREYDRFVKVRQDLFDEHQRFDLVGMTYSDIRALKFEFKKNHNIRSLSEFESYMGRKDFTVIERQKDNILDFKKVSLRDLPEDAVFRGRAVKDSANGHPSYIFEIA